MFSRQQKRTLNAILRSRLLQAGLLVAIVLVSHSAYERYEVAERMKDRRVAREEQVAALAAREAALRAEVEYLSHERGIEAEIRRQFDVAREGEQVVVIVEEESNGPEVLPLTAPTTTLDSPAWYEFWR